MAYGTCLLLAIQEMTLEEYEKVLEEKRKALQALKSEERKVDSKEFASMQQLSSKKGADDVFIKLVNPIVIFAVFNYTFIFMNLSSNEVFDFSFSRVLKKLSERGF